MANFNIQLMLINSSFKILGILYAYKTKGELKKMKKIIATLIAVLMLVMMIPQNVCASGQVTPSGISYDDIGSEIDAYIKKYEAGLASVGTCVFDETGIIYEGYYGYSDIEVGILADKETVYDWGSTSKLLVWVSVMQLMEQGKLDLETDLREYLPKGFLTKLQYEDETITMLNLMNHDAGFQESMYENQLATEDELYDSLEEAVKACECYQAYHVGEHTAYSNWGTALAAFIVERVSGMSYVDYVNENIFKPLGMENTSIGMHMEDNEWVRNQREELKCYARYAQEEYNADYGVCHSWVQLYPAGAAIGTTSDLAKFAQGFVATECPFFNSNETRNEMFTATSFYGDSNIAENCHGLWVEQFKVPTLGHSGNTGGCTANIQFDPESGLGIVVFTNEPGETMFSTGLVGLLFGDVRDSELVRNNPIQEHYDISGIYVPRRTIVCGFGSALKYSYGCFFATKTDNPDVFDMPLTGGMQMIHIGDHMWLQTSESGANFFTYESVDADGNRQFEMMSTDMVQNNQHIGGIVVYFGFALFGIFCLLILVIKRLTLLFRKIRKKDKALTKADKQIIVQQLIQGVSGVILFCLISVIGAKGYAFAVFSCIMVTILALLSFANGIILFKNTWRKKEIGKWKKVKQYLWVALCFVYVAIIIWFQLYDFVHI